MRCHGVLSLALVGGGPEGPRAGLEAFLQAEKLEEVSLYFPDQKGWLRAFASLFACDSMGALCNHLSLAGLCPELLTMQCCLFLVRLAKTRASDSEWFICDVSAGLRICQADHWPDLKRFEGKEGACTLRGLLLQYELEHGMTPAPSVLAAAVEKRC
jgi:hypothetical protein